MIEGIEVSAAFAASVSLLGAWIEAHYWRTTGGITQWRLGCLGGSLYRKRKGG